MNKRGKAEESKRWQTSTKSATPTKEELLTILSISATKTPRRVTIWDRKMQISRLEAFLGPKTSTCWAITAIISQMVNPDRQLKFQSIQSTIHQAAVEANSAEQVLKCSAMALLDVPSECRRSNLANVLVKAWMSPRCTAVQHIKRGHLYNNRTWTTVVQCCLLTRLNSNFIKTVNNPLKSMETKRIHSSRRFRAHRLLREVPTPITTD